MLDSTTIAAAAARIATAAEASHHFSASLLHKTRVVANY